MTDSKFLKIYKKEAGASPPPTSRVGWVGMSYAEPPTKTKTFPFRFCFTPASQGRFKEF